MMMHPHQPTTDSRRRGASRAGALWRGLLGAIAASALGAGLFRERGIAEPPLDAGLAAGHPVAAAAEPHAEPPTPDDRVPPGAVIGTGDAAGGEEGTDRGSDEQLREAILGEWTQERHGTRRLTVRSDGTASMHVTFSEIWKYLFGKEVQLQIRWTIAEGRLSFETVNGEPAESFKIISQMFGRTRSYPILQLDREQLLLSDEADGSQDLWRRPGAAESSALPE